MGISKNRMSIGHSIFWNTCSQVFLMMPGGYQLGTHQRLIPSGYHRNIDTYIWASSFTSCKALRGGLYWIGAHTRLPLGLFTLHLKHLVQIFLLKVITTSWAAVGSWGLGKCWPVIGFLFHNQSDRLFEVVFFNFWTTLGINCQKLLWEFKLVYQCQNCFENLNLSVINLTLKCHTLDFCSIILIQYIPVTRNSETV